MNSTTSLPVSTERRRGPSRAPGVRSGLLVAGVALLLLPAGALGQVQFVNASSGASAGTTTSFSFQHTVNAGTDRVLIVGGAIRAGAPVAFTSVTYNGIALTPIQGVTGADDVRAELWYLINPPIGTFNVTLTASANRNLAGGAMTFTGVHQTTPVGTPASVGGQSNSTSVDVTSASGEMVVDVVAQRDPGGMGTLTAGPGQTEQYRRDHPNTNMRIAGSTEPGAASVTMSWTFTLNPRHAQVAVPLRPSAVSYGVDVTPDTATASQLPSGGTNYTVDFTVRNTGSASDSFDLLTTKVPGSVITVVSITGTGVTQGGNPDSARLAGLGAGSSAIATVTYSVGAVPAGSTDTLVFTARSVGSPATSNAGRLELTVIRPTLTTGKAVNPSGTQAPGIDLTYTITFTNAGSAPAVSAVIVDTLPGQVNFMVGSVVNSLPPGVSVAVEYSNDGGATWTYVPASTACGAPAGYDACANRIRWRLLSDLSATAPDNTGTLEFVARIR